MDPPWHSVDGVTVVNIWAVQDEDAIHVHCKNGANIVNQIGNLPGYKTVCYEPTVIANILSMSRVTRKFRVVFDSEEGNLSRMVLLYRELRFQLIPNVLCYSGAIDR